MKYNKRIMIVLFITISFLLGINNVSAESCADSPYQCITCHYTLDADSGADYAGTKLRITVKADKNGNLTKTSVLTNDSYTLDDSNLKEISFVINNRLDCPSIYVKPDSRIGTTSIEISTNSDLKNKASFNNKEDNGKSYILACSNVMIVSIDEARLAIDSKDVGAVNIASEKATISITNNDVSVTNINSKYNLSSDYKNGITASDFKNGCRKDIVVYCKNDNGSMNSCRLSKGSDLYNKYAYPAIYDTFVAPFDTEGVLAKYEYTEYQARCSDVKHLTRIWFLIKLLAPFLLIIFTAYDYLRVVMAGNEEEMKKIKKNVPKRLIAFILLLFTPFIVKFIINNFGKNGAENTSMLKCIINGDLGEDDDEYVSGKSESNIQDIFNSVKTLQKEINEAANNSSGNEENTTNQQSSSDTNTNDNNRENLLNDLEGKL